MRGRRLRTGKATRQIDACVIGLLEHDDNALVGVDLSQAIGEALANPSHIVDADPVIDFAFGGADAVRIPAVGEAPAIMTGHRSEAICRYAALTLRSQPLSGTPLK